MEKKTFAVLGMACAGCAANVERKLNSIDGVKSAVVNFAAHTALVEYDKKVVTPGQMKDDIIKIGYDLVIENDRSVAEIEKNDFNLNISRYVSTAEAEGEIDLTAVHTELVSLEQKRKAALDKHNAFLKELGLPPLP